MWKAFVRFIRQAANTYEALSPASRQTIFPRLLICHDQVDDAYQQADWKAFESALAKARGLFDRGQRVLPEQ